MKTLNNRPALARSEQSKGFAVSIYGLAMSDARAAITGRSDRGRGEAVSGFASVPLPHFCRTPSFRSYGVRTGVGTNY
ncbi:MAG TPA: hypothetical protein VLZ74_00965 [Methylocella sp.]|nr:hypothetical protein [Methylocella sp.]